MKITRKCAGCKEEFRKDQMIEYSSLSGKTSAWYCPTCLAEKQARERFANKVCEIFGLKSPGPRIWTERKRLREKFGYTDNSIIDCLDYIYHVQKTDKLAESLALVGPRSMEGMKRWKAAEKGRASGIAAAIVNTEVREYEVPINEKKKEKKEIDLDEYLFAE